jgi:dihydrofolate reductase
MLIFFEQRTTYEEGSFPENVVVNVVSKTLPEKAGINVFRSVESVVINSKNNNDNDNKPVFVIGGEKIYEYFLPFCSEIYLSKTKKKYEGNVYFPQYNRLFDEKETVKETAEWKAGIYRRK